MKKDLYSLSHYSRHLLHFTLFLHDPSFYSSHCCGSQTAGKARQHLPGIFVFFLSCLKHHSTGSKCKLTQHLGLYHPKSCQLSAEVGARESWPAGPDGDESCAVSWLSTFNDTSYSSWEKWCAESHNRSSQLFLGPRDKTFLMQQRTPWNLKRSSHHAAGHL